MSPQVAMLDSQVSHIRLEASTIEKLKWMALLLVDRGFGTFACRYDADSGTFALQAERTQGNDEPQDFVFGHFICNSSAWLSEGIYADASGSFCLDGGRSGLSFEWILNGEVLPWTQPILKVGVAEKEGLNVLELNVSSQGRSEYAKRSFRVFRRVDGAGIEPIVVRDHLIEGLKLVKGMNLVRIPAEEFSVVGSLANTSMEFDFPEAARTEGTFRIEYNGSSMKLGRDQNGILFRSVPSGKDFEFGILSPRNVEARLKWWPVRAAEQAPGGKAFAWFEGARLHHEIRLGDGAMERFVASNALFCIGRDSYGTGWLPQSLSIQVNPAPREKKGLEGCLIHQGKECPLAPWHNILQLGAFDASADTWFQIRLREPCWLQVTSWAA